MLLVIEFARKAYRHEAPALYMGTPQRKRIKGLLTVAFSVFVLDGTKLLSFQGMAEAQECSPSPQSGGPSLGTNPVINPGTHRQIWDGGKSGL